jgi:predicted Zn finger-like uncharacterized protein
MNIRCPHCQTVFRIDPARVPLRGVRARCARCRGIFRVEPPTSAERSEPAKTVAPAAPPTQAPVPPAHAEAGHAKAGTSVESTPAAEPQAPGDPAGLSAQAEPARFTEPAAPAEATEPGERAEPAHPAISAGPTERAEPRQPSEPVRSAEPTVPAEPSEPTERAATGAPEAPGESAATATAGATPRKVPSFAARDPDARAQRLARALVSDIVAYHPERVERTLAGGSLRTEFRDEILKSWDEYVAQVGMERARSTPYFREALNEILARGRKVF